MKQERLQNLVGALALTITDELLAEAEMLAPRNEPAAAIAIIGRSPGWTIRQLSNDIDLSHAATVRLVDRLVDDSLMVRIRSKNDGRAVELSLTSAGQDIYREMLTSRHKRLAGLLSYLTDQEKEILGTISEKVLALIAKGNATGRSRMCRLCDTGSCKTCPIDVALSSWPADQDND